MKQKTSSLPNAMLKKTVVITVAVLLSFGLFSYAIISTQVQAVLKQEIESVQKIFLDSVANDIVSGNYSDTYYKCRSLIHRKLALGIMITNSHGHNICNIEPERQDDYIHWYSKDLYFDNTEHHKAAIIKLAYSTEVEKSILLKSSLLLFGTLLILTFLFFLVFKRMSWKLSKPVIELANQLKAGRLESLAKIQEKARLSHIQEVHVLYEGTEILAKKLILSREQLREKTREEALAGIAQREAHDIRSPLSAMGAAIEYFGHLKMADEKGTKVLNILELSAKRLTGIADDLLKNHQGKEAGEGVVFSIHHVLDELIGEFGGQDQYKDVCFVKRYDSGAIHIRGDGAKLQRAFGNILKNAAEAMEFRGGITVTTKASEDRASVGITDTGPGMSEEKLEKVLAGGFTEGKQDGHGIGTKVVKEAIEEHSGILRAESRVGEGTTFFIDLPRVTQTLPATTFTLTLNPEERVLIVDDEASLREQWRFILENHGIHTLLCKSYEDVVEHGISPALTSAAIVDYHFNNSEKNGIDVVKYLQSVGFTNLTLCTAEYWKPQLQREGRELGVLICPKPIPTIVIAAPEQAVIANPEGVKQSRLDRHVALRAPRDDDQKNYNVLVIDDDLGIRMSWDFSREKLQISHLHCYTNLEELQSNGIDLATIDIAFVDKNIEGSQFSGAQVIQHLKANGVARVALASGESEETLRQDPQFSNVDFIIGKNIPTSFKGFFS